MVKYILKRLVYVVVVFVILSFLMFFLYNLTPGDPVRDMLEPQKDKMTPEEYRIEYERLTAQLGLDKPMVVQYWKWFTICFRETWLLVILQGRCSESSSRAGSEHAVFEHRYYDIGAGNNDSIGY